MNAFSYFFHGKQCEETTKTTHIAFTSSDFIWNLSSILKYFDMKHLLRSFEIVETVKEENMSARYVTSDMLLVL